MTFIHKINELRTQPPTFWIELANTRLPGALCALLILAIALYLAKFVWVLVPLQSSFDWSVKPAANNSALPLNSDSTQVNYRTIVSAHIFGEAGAQPVLTKAVDAPDTRLNLKLRGTIAAGDDKFAHAIIGDGKGKNEVYFIKDSVPGGAVLHAVYPDRVILNRAGTLETLRLPRTSESLGRPAIQQPQQAARDTSPPGSIQEMMQQPGGSFTDVLRPQPYMPNGQLKGYRVYPGRDRRKFAALGLRPGDLVTDINGQPLNNLQSGMEVFKNLGDATSLTVTIERNGSPMALTLDTSPFSDTSGGNK
jgi:general secretion pathway protein C